MPTIGVAVGLPEPDATFLQNVRRASGDPEADQIRTHVTLLPPTVVPDVSIGDIEAHLDRVACLHRQFVLEVSRVGTFRPVSPVQFLSVTRGAANCAELARSIRSGPLDRALEHPYHPHVTIAQQVPDAALDAVGDELAEYRLAFEVTSFQLYQRDSIGTWHPVRCFELAAR